MWVCGAWVYIGGRTTPALNIGLIYAASPILVVALGRLLYARTPDGRAHRRHRALPGRRRRGLRQGPVREPPGRALHRGRSLDRRGLCLLGPLFGTAEAAAQCPRSAGAAVRHLLRRIPRAAALHARRGRPLAGPGLRRLAHLGRVGGPGHRARRRRLRRLRLLHPRARALGHQRVHVPGAPLCRTDGLAHPWRSAAGATI